MEDLEKKLVQAVNEGGGGYLYDFIADHYWEMTTYQLKEVLLAVLGVCLDKCYDLGDEEELGHLIIHELQARMFGFDDPEDSDQ